LCSIGIENNSGPRTTEYATFSASPSLFLSPAQVSMVISGLSSSVKVFDPPVLHVCFDQPLAALPSIVAFFAQPGTRM
jgi:hypothetical protein